MAVSNILLKEVTIGLFLLISYDGSNLSHYESQSQPSQLEFLFECYCSVPSQKPSRNHILFIKTSIILKQKIAQTHGLSDFSIRELV